MKEDAHLFQGDDLTGDKNFAYFFAAAVVLDTYNFKPALKNSKWQDEDFTAYEWLSSHAPIGKEYFDNMHDTKFSQEIAIELGVLGNLHRDFKNYTICRESVTGVLGLSVMVFQAQALFDRYGHDSVCKDIEIFMDEKGLSLFGIITSAINPQSHDNERAIMIYSRSNRPVTHFFDDFCKAISADTMLQATDLVEKTFGESKLAFWQVKNLSASRKKFEVFLRSFYTAQ